MFIVKLSREQLEMLDDAVGRARLAINLPLRLAFDPIDNSIKWKLGEYIWSPPCQTEEQ
jgi:hypothetical protein